MNVHLGYIDTPYARHDRVGQALRDLGVRYVRDGLNPGQPRVYAAWRALASCGIRLNLLVGDPLHRHGIGTLESQLRLLRRARLQRILAAIEAPNELDIQGAPNWRPLLLEFLPRLRRGVRSKPSLSRLPIVGPSLVHPESRDAVGDVSRFFDYGNIHPYPSGQAPDRDFDLGRELADAEANSRSLPLQATETGYHNALRSDSPHLPASERAAGIYFPRLYLDYFRRGISRTYAYELLDQRPDKAKRDLEANFGLLRNDYSHKPAYRSIRRMIRLLSDPGRPHKTAALKYSVRSSTPGLRTVVLQKRDGTFYLALWRKESVWDPDARRAARASSNRVRLTLGASARRVAVYRPSESSRARSVHTDTRSLAVAASPSVAILKIDR